MLPDAPVQRVERTPRRPGRKPRLTVRGALDRRMACSVNKTLREVGEPRRYHWSRLCGFRLADLQAHIEAQFTDGMNWDLFLAGKIDLDHVIPQSWFPYRSSADLAFRDCWSLPNFQPLWSDRNRSKGARYAGPAKDSLDPSVPVVTE